MMFLIIGLLPYNLTMDRPSQGPKGLTSSIEHDIAPRLGAVGDLPLFARLSLVRSDQNRAMSKLLFRGALPNLSNECGGLAIAF